MSTIISFNLKVNKPSIDIFAPECKTVISGTDINGHIITITGDAEAPFIHAIRFHDCIIIADNLLAFSQCYFDESCIMKVENMPVSGIESINNNAVACEKHKTFNPADYVVWPPAKDCSSYGLSFASGGWMPGSYDSEESALRGAECCEVDEGRFVEEIQNPINSVKLLNRDLTMADMEVFK